MPRRQQGPKRWSFSHSFRNLKSDVERFKLQMRLFDTSWPFHYHIITRYVNSCNLLKLIYIFHAQTMGYLIIFDHYLDENGIHIFQNLGNFPRFIQKILGTMRSYLSIKHAGCMREQQFPNWGKLYSKCWLFLKSPFLAIWIYRCTVPAYRLQTCSKCFKDLVEVGDEDLASQLLSYSLLVFNKQQAII